MRNGVRVRRSLVVVLPRGSRKILVVGDDRGVAQHVLDHVVLHSDLQRLGQVIQIFRDVLHNVVGLGFLTVVVEHFHGNIGAVVALARIHLETDTGHGVAAVSHAQLMTPQQLGFVDAADQVAALVSDLDRKQRIPQKLFHVLSVGDRQIRQWDVDVKN